VHLISSAIVNERGGEGERAFLDSVVNSAVTVAGSIPLPSAAPNSQNTGLTEPTSFSAPLFDGDGNLMPGVVDTSKPIVDQIEALQAQLQNQGLSSQESFLLAMDSLWLAPSQPLGPPFAGVPKLDPTATSNPHQ
jgi:hypothetical protein